jgi:hypothetical protein
MIITLTLLLLLGAFLVTLASALGKAPLWIGVLLLTIAVALGAYPGHV